MDLESVFAAKVCHRRVASRCCFFFFSFFCLHRSAGDILLEEFLFTNVTPVPANLTIKFKYVAAVPVSFIEFVSDNVSSATATATANCCAVGSVLQHVYSSHLCSVSPFVCRTFNRKSHFSDDTRYVCE